MPYSRREVVLAGLSAAGREVGLFPVQVQKIFFLIDEEVRDDIDGPHFDFRPYNYGPFDREVYDAIDELATDGLASVGSNGKHRIYSVTKRGYEEGQRILSTMDEETRQYIKEVAEWASRLTFDQIVSAIYKKYPRMKENSIFQQ